jgi:hypothetical protein
LIDSTVEIARTLPSREKVMTFALERQVAMIDAMVNDGDM